MRYLLPLTMGVLLSVVGASIYAATHAAETNSDQQNSQSQPKLTSPMKSISVSANEPHFTIHLKANPTTGYQWIIRDHSDEIVPLSSQYHAPKKTIPGAGGYSSWHFKVKKQAFSAPMELSVTLVYKKSWKAEGGEVKRFIIHTQPQDDKKDQ